jgi:hypothetical protein
MKAPRCGLTVARLAAPADSYELSNSNRAMSRVPRPVRLMTSRVPPSTSTRSRRADQSRSRRGVCTPEAAVADVHPERGNGGRLRRPTWLRPLSRVHAQLPSSSLLPEHGDCDRRAGHPRRGLRQLHRESRAWRRSVLQQLSDRPEMVVTEGDDPELHTLGGAFFPDIRSMYLTVAGAMGVSRGLTGSHFRTAGRREQARPTTTAERPDVCRDERALVSGQLHTTALTTSEPGRPQRAPNDREAQHASQACRAPITPSARPGSACGRQYGIGDSAQLYVLVAARASNLAQVRMAQRAGSLLALGRAWLRRYGWH